MRTVGAILEAKHVKDVVAVSPSATVFDAAELMSSHNVGCALVRDGAGRLVGIFSERDLMKRVVAASLDPRTARVEDVMTSSVRRIPSGLSVEDALSLMVVHSHRHMVVEDSGQVHGVVSIRDLMSALVLPDRSIAAEGRVGVIRARTEDSLRTVQQRVAGDAPPPAL